MHIKWMYLGSAETSARVCDITFTKTEKETQSNKVRPYPGHGVYSVASWTCQREWFIFKWHIKRVGGCISELCAIPDTKGW
jgi:hypothetical protein